MEKIGIECLVIIGAIIFLGIIGAAGGSKSSTNTTPTSSTVSETTTPTPEEVTKVSAREFVDEFESNQVAAEKKWGGKTIQFSATITNITDYGISFANVASKQFSFAQISCKVKDKEQLLSIKKDQTITVKGIVGKQTVGVIVVTNCEVVK